jgi:hypothetical protein
MLLPSSHRQFHASRRTHTQQPVIMTAAMVAAAIILMQTV